MMRYLRGMVLLGVSAALWACNTESNAVKGGTPERLFLDPYAMTIDSGATKGVLVRVLDQQGGALTEPITISNVGTGITVTGDSGFRPIYDAEGELVFNPFNNEFRLLVSGDNLSSTTFDVTGGGFTETVSVLVVPETLDGILSDESVVVNDIVTLTAPPQFRFTEDTEISFDLGDDNAEIVSRSADGTTIEFRVFPGSGGAMTISNVNLTYAPDVTIPFQNSTTVGLEAGTPFSSDTIEQAPILQAPALGESLTFLDRVLGVDQYYHIETTAPNTTLEVTFDWGDDGDIDVFFRTEAGGALPPGTVTDGGATGDHPETLAATFALPGVYTIWANIYDGNATWYRPTITRTQ